VYWFAKKRILLLCCGFVFACNAAHARENILTGAVSVRYDHQE